MLVIRKFERKKRDDINIDLAKPHGLSIVLNFTLKEKCVKLMMILDLTEIGGN